MSLVVKNGSNARAWTSGGMPWPLSATEILTNSLDAPSSSVRMHVLDGDGDDTAVCHGVSRIQAQVQDRELHLAGIDFDRPDPGPNVICTLMWPPSDPSSMARMLFRCVATSIDSGIHGPAARESQQMPRQTGAAGDGPAHRLEHPRRRRPGAGPLEQLQTAREYGEQIVEVVRDAARQLAERFHLLRLTQRRFRLPQPLLIAQPLGHVIDELVGPDAVAVAIPQRVETHLVRAPVSRWIAELLDGGELFAGERSAPHGLDGALMVGLRRQQIEHAVAGFRTNAEDALELLRGRAD